MRKRSEQSAGRGRSRVTEAPGSDQGGRNGYDQHQERTRCCPSKYTIMPVARGKKVEVASEMIGDTVRNSIGEDIGKLEQLIMDSETKRVEYAMISIGDTGQLKAYPWSSFKVNKEQGNVVLDVTPEQLQAKATDLSPGIQEIEQQLQALQKSEARIGTRDGQNMGNRGSGGPMGETTKGGGGAERAPVDKK
jgi:sporulation protein YlmC with PRC-barrel domain